MLNLPRVTGWGTDTIANTMLRKSAEERETEKERTRMIGNALLQQAKEGNLNDSGYSFLSQRFPELAGTAKQANETAQTENKLKMNNMILQKKELGLKMMHSDIDAALKFNDPKKYGEAGADLMRKALEKAKERAKLYGYNLNVSEYMDPVDIKNEIRKFDMTVINENLRGLSDPNITEETINGVERLVQQFASNNAKDPAVGFMKTTIDKARERITKKAEVAAAKQAEIEKEKRERQAKQEDKEYYMTSPDGKRKARFPARLVGQMEKAGWTVGEPVTDKETGTLTEASVVTQFDNFALDKGTPELKGQMYDEYLQLREKKMSREDAFNEVLRKHGLPEVPKVTPITPNQKDFSSLWR